MESATIAVGNQPDLPEQSACSARPVVGPALRSARETTRHLLVCLYGWEMEMDNPNYPIYVSAKTYNMALFVSVSNIDTK